MAKNKKRGRKPKPKTTKDFLPKVKKKRGRKPKNIKETDVIVENNILNVKQQIDSIILYLPVHSTQINNDFVEDQFLTYNPEIPNSPKGIESSKFDFYETTKKVAKKMIRSDTSKIVNIEQTEEIEINIENQGIMMENELFQKEELDFDYSKMIQSVHKNKQIYNGGEEGHSKSIETHSNMMVEFSESNFDKQWPSKTSIYCFWCVFPFNSTPCAIPMKYIQNIFYVYGCFCSPECAAAYIFDNHSSDTVWEQYTLLNLLYKDIYGNNRIKIALPRNALQIFGGYMSIQDFRSFHNNKYKEATLIMPPLYSIIPQIEENYIESSSKKKRFVPIDMDKVKKAKENLRLKRTKPVLKYKNTLENCMNLTYI